ncbi:MAG TPA: hypothetical protein PLH57_06125 [Oligoflexia bacterium]|nr:hypothetical protein [Oligoflexia bacterium]
MISYQIYKLMHLTGILMIFLGLGGVAMHAINGGPRAHRWKRGVALTHGVGMLLTLVGGFGLLARLGMAANMPGWAYAKIVIWLGLGGALALFIRKQSCAKKAWFGVLVLGLAAAYLANYKPF